MGDPLLLKDIAIPTDLCICFIFVDGFDGNDQSEFGDISSTGE